MSAAIDALEDAKATRLDDVKEYDFKIEQHRKIIESVAKAKADLTASIDDIERALQCLKQRGWKTDKPVKVL